MQSVRRLSWLFCLENSIWTCCGDMVAARRCTSSTCDLAPTPLPTAPRLVSSFLLSFFIPLLLYASPLWDADRQQGGGYEDVSAYPGAELRFMGIANIHAMRCASVTVAVGAMIDSWVVVVFIFKLIVDFLVPLSL
jgi:hypothetical protein